jgi:hypothetical protein
MELDSNTSLKRAVRRIDRRPIEGIWKFERKWLFPVPQRQLEVPVYTPEPEEDFELMKMDDIDEELTIKPGIGKWQFIVVVIFLMLLTCVVVFMVMFTDLKSFPNDFLKRLS